MSEEFIEALLERQPEHSITFAILIMQQIEMALTHLILFRTNIRISGQFGLPRDIASPEI